MFKIRWIPNMDKFLTVVSQSEGDVMLQMPEGEACNLKTDHTARQLLRLVKPGKDGLDISLSNPKDFASFVQYMMEASAS
jgi:hypothetical protein